MRPDIIVRGGGDIATGTIHKLHQCGFSVLILEKEQPSAIRRSVAFSEAVYAGTTMVEQVVCKRAESLQEASQILDAGAVPICIDPVGTLIEQVRPKVLVDAILAKKNLGTRRDMAALTIGLGEGFTAGKDVDVVVETLPGHDLGRLIWQGSACPQTKTSGGDGGYEQARVQQVPVAGMLFGCKKITDKVKEGEVIAYIQQDEVRSEIKAPVCGIVRGMLPDGYPVRKGYKIADIDPDMEKIDDCYKISDQARCIAGGVLEAVLSAHARQWIRNQEM